MGSCPARRDTSIVPAVSGFRCAAHDTWPSRSSPHHRHVRQAHRSRWHSRPRLRLHSAGIVRPIRATVPPYFRWVISPIALSLDPLPSRTTCCSSARQSIRLPTQGIQYRPGTSVPSRSVRVRRMQEKQRELSMRRGHQWTSTDVCGWLPGPDSKSGANVESIRGVCIDCTSRTDGQCCVLITLPPTTLISTGMCNSRSFGTVRGSSPSTVKSAYRPIVSLPRSFS